MERWQRSILVLLTSAILLLGAFSAGYSLGTDDGPRSVTPVGTHGRGPAVVRDAFRAIRQNAVDPPSEDVLARGAVRGMIEVLRKNNDPFALFYSPRGYRSFQELTTGRFSGIGVWLKQKNEELHIVSVLPRSPALEAGLRNGDVIRSVDGEPVDEMTLDETVARIKGPAGTDVAVGVERRGERLTFEMTRAALELPNVVGRTAAGGQLGYLRLFGFARGASRQVKKEITRLEERGVDGFVLDLRDNGGGLFQEAIDIASLFIEDGKIVTYRDRATGSTVYEARGNAFESIPLVVLVNEGTASASEIVAGALQDRDRAIVVGVTTYGKGSVQEVVSLPDASAFKLTTGAYLTPSGKKITGRGIEPDVAVHAGPAVQKNRAVEILKGIVLSGADNRG